MSYGSKVTKVALKKKEGNSSFLKEYHRKQQELQLPGTEQLSRILKVRRRLWLAAPGASPLHVRGPRSLIRGCPEGVVAYAHPLCTTM